jgi:hypothetical protein
MSSNIEENKTLVRRFFAAIEARIIQKRNLRSSGCRAMIVVEHPAEALAPLNAVME